ncbi:MAG: hypothetical protein KDA60_05405, partial [Planctomycetales bacterium]|nr:hypothetical protein [Planctomycetales bacterium]
MISLRNQSLVGFVLVSLASWAQAYTPDDDGSNPRQYAVDASGNWGDNQNWDLGSPNSRELFAVFDEAYVPYGHTVVTDEDIELDGIHFNTPGTINLAGVGAFNLMGNEREASLNGWQGHQVFQARVNLQNT